MHLSLNIALGRPPVASAAPVVANAYARPDGTSLYNRPDGTSLYTQPSGG